ncbi:MAG: STAS domain-containing protein [Pseudomonadota bacterium]
MFEVNHIHGISVVGLQGELSRRNVHVLESVLSSLSKCEQRNVVLNFSELRHLDYSLVQRIAERIIEFQCDGGDLKMAAASGYIKEIFQAMGLADPVYASVEEALLDFVGDIPDEDPQ